MNISHSNPITKTKIDQNSRQNFILSHRFPRETCRARRDLQLSLGNLPLKMKFCLRFWSIFVSQMDRCSTANPRSHHRSLIDLSKWKEIRPPSTRGRPPPRQRSTKTLDKTSSSTIGSQGKVVALAKIYNFPLETYP